MSPNDSNTLQNFQEIFICHHFVLKSLNTSLRQLALAFLLLILSGDVHTNPGPTKFPCDTCHRLVANNHRVMGFGNCGAWVHIKFCGVTPKQYSDYLPWVVLVDWECPACNVPTDASASNSSDSETDSFHLSSSSQDITEPQPPPSHDSRSK